MLLRYFAYQVFQICKSIIAVWQVPENSRNKTPTQEEESRCFHTKQPLAHIHLPSVGKVIEKVPYRLLKSNYFFYLLSGLRANHSIETALIQVLNDVCLNTDTDKTSVQLLLDLSAAFDTADHNYITTQTVTLG